MTHSRTSTWTKGILREAIAECFGTCVCVLFGCGSVAQLVLSRGVLGSADQIPWSLGFAVAFGVFVAGGISGGHINPAVTLAMCVTKKCQWKKLIPYWIGQYLGGFLGSCIIYVIYYDAFESFENGQKTMVTAEIFGTFPTKSYSLSIWNGLADQTFGAAILLFMIMALTDDRNMAPAKGCLPIFIGLTVTSIGMAFGLNCSFAINPARDLSPRLFTLAAGWGKTVFSYNNYKWFWIPVLGPYLGGVIGACTYVSFIQMKFPFQGIYSRSESPSPYELESQTEPSTQEDANGRESTVM